VLACFVCVHLVEGVLVKRPDIAVRSLCLSAIQHVVLVEGLEAGQVRVERGL
jgi:hypothetical protein